MKFEIRFIDAEKYPIDRFIDGFKDTLEAREYHISVSFLDHRKNSAIILATGEFGEYMKSKFGRNKNLVFTLPDNYHNPFHVKTMNKDGYLECGCGWKESAQEKVKREIVIVEHKSDSELEMSIVRI